MESQTDRQVDRQTQKDRQTGQHSWSESAFKQERTFLLNKNLNGHFVYSSTQWINVYQMVCLL